MTVWRVHLRPDANKIDPVEFCLRQKVVGIGLGVSAKPADIDAYLSLGRKEYGDAGWYKAANAIGLRMAVGDLVWVRDFCGAYYLGRISGEWEYRDDPENLEADIINVRSCEFFLVATIIAGKIVNCFRPSATVQQIHDDTSKLFSTIVYNQLTDGDLPYIRPPKIDIFSLLSDVDLEDVIGLYLQHTKGLLFVPSSRSRQNTTPFYEYQLVDAKSGPPAYVQVKSGDIKLNPNNYYDFPAKPYKFYLFSPAGYTSTSTSEHVVCLDRADIQLFLDSARHFLPLNISTWLDKRDELTGRQ